MSMSEPVGLPCSSKNSWGGYGMSEQTNRLPARMSCSLGTVATGVGLGDGLGAGDGDGAVLGAAGLGDAAPVQPASRATKSRTGARRLSVMVCLSSDSAFGRPRRGGPPPRPDIVGTPAIAARAGRSVRKRLRSSLREL